MSDVDTSFMEKPTEQINHSVADEVGKMMRILSAKELEIATKEAELKLLQADKDILIKETIPQLFKKNGMMGTILNDGTKVNITEELACSLIKDPERRNLALAWLIDNGGEDLIKDFILIESPSVALLELLVKGGVVFTATKDVNTNSLKAWFREKLGLKKGIIATLRREDIPKEFGVFTYDLAKITAPK